MSEGHQRRRVRYLISRRRLLQLNVCLLVVLLATPLVVHYNISNMTCEDPHVHKLFRCDHCEKCLVIQTTGNQGSQKLTLGKLRSRSQLALNDGLENVVSTSLKGQIEEVRRIMASVNNELRSMEGKRPSLQSEMFRYETQVKSFWVQQEKLQKEEQQSGLRFGEMAKANKFVAPTRAPEFVAVPESPRSHQAPPLSQQAPPLLHETCQMHTCFEFSRCPLQSGFPVYVYDLSEEFQASKLDDFVRTSLLSAFRQSPYVTDSANSACVYVVVVGETSQPDDLKRLHSLPYWNGDGRNHVLLNLARSLTTLDQDTAINTGRAMLVQSSFANTVFRNKFDIVIPPGLGKSDGPVWADLPPVVPLRRNFFVSFYGEFNEYYDRNTAGSEPSSNSASSELKAATGNGVLNKILINSLLELEITVVRKLKKIESDYNEKVHLDFTCGEAERYGIVGEWCLCGGQSQRAAILKQSTFTILIAPANVSVVSTTVFQARLYESLQYGAVPVILGEYSVLPYSELLDWSKAVLVLPKARVTELHFFLRSFTDVDLMELKRNGRIFWERYFGTISSIVETTLAVLRTRLQIPAKPVKEIESPNAVSTFIPIIKYLGVNADEETGEVLGPVEPPFSSQMYAHNFSAHTQRGVFNMPGDPFHLYPFTPFEPVLSTDAQFRGSGSGFQPINKGEGGSGREFGEAIGGNHPREQFTVVMLTYERSEMLIKALTRLKGLPYLNKVVVVWNSPHTPPENLGWPDIGVPVVVLKMTKNSLNNRFLPFEAIETEAILSIDDDSHLRHDEIVFGFRVWREERGRIVGFPGRYHAWDAKSDAWLYRSGYTCEMSMVLTGAAFFHKYYTYLYSFTLPKAVRDEVDEYMNCEDIAMNFLVSHITRRPPVKVTSRWSFVCPDCPQNLSLDRTHFEERHKCINLFVQVFGYMPLLYTQYRADSILFETEGLNDTQKCFKFI